jgi:hypothetical protein
MTTKYDEFKKRNKDCCVLPEHELNHAVANTDEYLRRWFKEET